MSQIRPREFTQEEANEFKLAMRDPVKWKELYDKVDKRNKELYGDTNKAVNEHGFTDEEVTFLKDTFPSDESTTSENMITDDDLKFFDDAFEKGGRRRRKHRRTKKRMQRRSKKRTHKKRHTKRKRM